MKKLKSCPFCGGKAALNSYYSQRDGNFYVRVKCLNCRAQGEFYVSEDNPRDNNWNTDAANSAADAWNARVD